VEVSTLDARLQQSVANRRFTMTVLSAFGALSLLLAAIGLYALLSYAVVQRTRELAVRAALGARREQLLALVFSDGVRIVLGGVAVGLAGAVAVTRAMRHLLVDAAPLDGVAYVTATIVLVAAALVAIIVPAWRATRLDPMIALQSE
jgi:putative ABC transport system permease protein